MQDVDDDHRPAPAATRRRVGRLPVAVAAGFAVAVVIVVALALTSGPAGTPTGGRGPSGKTVLFSDTFSDGQWCNYNRVQNVDYSDPACGYHNDSYALRVEDGAARFEVRPGDSPGGGLGGGERSEISQDSAPWQAAEGDEWFVQERIRLAEDFTTSGRWAIITQFHAGSGPPPLTLQVSRRGKLILRSSGKAGDVNDDAGKGDRELIPADTFKEMRGRWFDVNLHVRWSKDPDVGGTEAYINGELVAPWRAQRTMSSSRIYWKAGIYRSPADRTQVMWLDDVVISTPESGNR
jgi:hypothetical protein